jgi:hypothetical protein
MQHAAMKWVMVLGLTVAWRKPGHDILYASGSLRRLGFLAKISIERAKNQDLSP